MIRYTEVYILKQISCVFPVCHINVSLFQEAQKRAIQVAQDRAYAQSIADSQAAHSRQQPQRNDRRLWSRHAQEPEQTFHQPSPQWLGSPSWLKYVQQCEPVQRFPKVQIDKRLSRTRHCRASCVHFTKVKKHVHKTQNSSFRIKT